MSAAPLTRRAAALDDTSSVRAYPPRLVRRRWSVGVAKRLLPLVALALLSLVALWPELSGDGERARMNFRRTEELPRSGQMVNATYHGVDERNRPYTVTARSARQVNPERVELVDPRSDMTLESGNWLLVQARHGVYLQHSGNLDLAGETHLYRDDGTTLTTETATVDIKAGAAAGADKVHAEGPFGSLDAQGFALVDKGAVIQFSGPGQMVLNAATNHAPPARTAEPVGVAEPPAAALRPR